MRLLIVTNEGMLERPFAWRHRLRLTNEMRTRRKRFAADLAGTWTATSTRGPAASDLDGGFFARFRRLVHRFDDREVAPSHFSRNARVALFGHALREIVHLDRLLVDGRIEMQRPPTGVDDHAAV